MFLPRTNANKNRFDRGTSSTICYITLCFRKSLYEKILQFVKLYDKSRWLILNSWIPELLWKIWIGWSDFVTNFYIIFHTSKRNLSIVKTLKFDVKVNLAEFFGPLHIRVLLKNKLFVWRQKLLISNILWWILIHKYNQM